MLASFSELQQWFLEYGALGLALLAFIESIIFPVPPDPLLISLSLLHPESALFYGGLTTVASVLGGIFGYFIGVHAGRPLLLKIFKKQQVKKVADLFNRYGGWAVFVAAFTPIPYKVFTISAGIGKINIVTFIVASTLGRGLRFVSIAVAISVFGEKAIEMIRSSFEVVTIGASLVILLAYLLYKYLRKRWNQQNS